MISAISEKGLGNSGDYKTTVSVVIVTYNSQNEIGLCLDALQFQLGDGQCEAIIIDNASEDGTPSEVHAHDTDGVTFIENRTNIGFTKAVNQGIAKSVGEFVFILNPDTQVSQKSINRLVEKLNSEPEIAAVAPQLRFPDGRIQYSCRRFPTHGNVISEMLGFNTQSEAQGWKMADFEHASERDVDQPAGAALMVRKSILDQLDGLDERFPMFFSDVDLCKRIKDADWRILFCAYALVRHKGGSAVFKRRSTMIVSSHVSLIKYFFKHFRRIRDVIPNIMMALLLFIGIPVRLIANYLSPRNQPEGEIL